MSLVRGTYTTTLHALSAAAHKHANTLRTADGETCVTAYKEHSDGRLEFGRRYGLRHFGDPTDDADLHGVAVPFIHTITLRDYQREAVDAFKAQYAKPHGGGGLLVFPCGFGKTLTACALVAEVGVKAMIVSHKNFLLEMFLTDLQKYVRVACDSGSTRELRIGWVRGPKCDVEGADIVLASLMSLATHTYADNAFESIGHVVIDECHRLCPQVSSRALFSISRPKMCGLSATPVRKDGLHTLFETFIGPIVAQQHRPQDQTVTVHLKAYSDNVAFGPPLKRRSFVPSANVLMTDMKGVISQNTHRTAVIVNDIVTAFLNGRCCLVMADRKALLQALQTAIVEKLREEAAVTDADVCGMYVGGKREAQLKAAAECPIILSTYAMTSEGFNKPQIDTLFLAMPRSEVEQIVGRALRPCDGKQPTVVYDYVDTEFAPLRGMSFKRLKHYNENGYRVVRSGGSVSSLAKKTNDSCTMTA